MSRHPKYELIWLTIYWERPLPYEQALGALQHLASLTHAPQIICETRATTHGVDYLVATQRRFIPKLRHTLEQLVPGTLVVEADSNDRRPVTTARKIVYSAPERALAGTDNEAATRGVLASLSGLHGSETIVLQVTLGNRHAPRELPGTSSRPVSVKVKAASFGFGAIVRLGVTAATAERRQRLTTGVLSALRSALTPGLELRLVPERVGVLNNPSPYWPLLAGFTRLSVDEVTLMAGWPVGTPKQPYPGLPPAHPTLLRPSFVSRETDRVTATSTAPGYISQTLGISERDSRRHLWILGPTGTGKSSLLLNLIHDDLTAGRPVIVIEPKDFITDLLSVIPKERLDDVVLLDPLDDTPTGFNPLDLAGRTTALVADQLFSFFVALYGREGIGPRSADILRLALDAVAHATNPTLAMLPLLLTNPGFRHRLTAPRIAADPLHAAPFWAWFESLSPDARTQIIAPLQNKLRLFLQEPLRSVLAQPSPLFNLRDVLTQKKILLVPLQSGVLGSEAAQLLGALVVNELWEALKERVAVPEKQRRTVMVYLDEAQVFLDELPIDMADALAMSRSLGASFHLIHQYTDQLSPKLLRAFESNARSKIFFQLTGRDATYAANLSPRARTCRLHGTAEPAPLRAARPRRHRHRVGVWSHQGHPCTVQRPDSDSRLVTAAVRATTRRRRTTTARPRCHTIYQPYGRSRYRREASKENPMTTQYPNHPENQPDSGLPIVLPTAAVASSVSSHASAIPSETVAAKDSSSSSSLPHTPPTSPHAGHRISRKQLEALRTSLSERDWNVIRMTGKFRFGTAKHLTLTLFQGHASEASAARTCRRVLARLRSQRILGIMERRIGGLRAGSEGMVYYLDTAGERLHRQVTGSTIRQRFEEPSARFMDHTLAIADIAAQLHHEVAIGDGEIVSLSPEPRRAFTAAHGGVGRLIPDLAVELAGEPGADTISAFFIEVDLGHESLPTLTNKCLAIEQYRASGEEQRQYGGFPRIIWAMDGAKPATTERRIAALIRAIAEHPQLPQHLYTVMHRKDVPATMLTEAKRS